MERWLGASVVQVSNIRAQNTCAYMRHFTGTLQASFANWGLNTEAELILARAGKFETYCDFLALARSDLF